MYVVNVGHFKIQVIYVVNVALTGHTFDDVWEIRFTVAPFRLLAGVKTLYTSRYVSIFRYCR